VVNAGGGTTAGFIAWQTQDNRNDPDPADLDTREIIRRAYSRPVVVKRAPAETVSQYIYRWYEAEVDMAAGEGEAEADLEDQLWDNPEHLRDMASEAPIIRLVNHLISRAVSLNASDIHIEPRKSHVQIRYRIDGVLHNMESINIKLKSAINLAVHFFDFQVCLVALVHSPKTYCVPVKTYQRSLGQSG